MLKRNQKSNIIISLDSDVLVSMSYLYKLKSDPNIQDLEFEKAQDILSSKKKRIVVEKLLEIYENEELYFFVSPPVYTEWRFSPIVKSFIEEHCLMPQINEDGNFLYEDEVKELADQYVRPTKIVHKDGSVSIDYPAMKSQYNANNSNLYEPTRDVYIMAWSAVFGFNLITNNYIDYISYGQEVLNPKTNKKQQDTKRRFNIRIVNKQQGWIITKKNGQYITSSPYGLMDIANILVDNNLDYYLSDTEGLSKADEIVKTLEARYKEQDKIYNYFDVESQLHDQ